jgi:hypothetical protein
MGAITDYFGAETTSKTNILIDHPQNYGGEENPYEAIKVIESWNLDFALGNVVKYINRAGKKGSKLEDLKKAQWYLNRAVEQAEKF